MVNRCISSDIKECALRLWTAGWQPDDICDILAVSQASIYRWRQIFEQYGNVNRPVQCLRGRRRIITTAVVDGLHLLLQINPDLYLDELVWWLGVEHGIAISTTSLHRTLKSLGLSRKILHKIAAERDEQKRTEWGETIQANFSGTGCEFIFVDETSKNDRSYARRYGRSLQGERAELVDVFQRGDRFSLAAALSDDGYLAVHAVPGSFDSWEFFDFIVEQVLPQMNAWPGPRSVLVMDNCRIHQSEALAEAVNAAGCMILYIPAYSPDFNPIEESFSSLKEHIRRHGNTLRQMPDPVEALLEACGHITPEMARGWIRNAGYIVT